MIIRNKAILIEPELLEDYQKCGKMLDNELLEIDTTSQCYIDIILKRVRLRKEQKNNGNKSIITNTQITTIGGVGTELTKLLSKIGITYNAGCPCKDRALYMDKMGIIWSQNHIHIIVQWLAEEAKRRSLPFSETVSKLLIKKAIKNAKKNLPLN